MSEKDKKQEQPTIAMTAEQLRQVLNEVLTKAQNGSEWQQAMQFQTVQPKETPYLTKPQEDVKAKKTLKTLQTKTFIDSMFLDENDKEVGIPLGSTTLLSGLPSSGKSLWIREIILQLANSGVKVAFATSEEIWSSDGDRYDLQSRFMETAKILSLNWTTIKDNLIVLDIVKNAELRNWETFIETYRNLVETKGITFVAIDSLTMLEDSRGQIKNRLSELCRYNQTKNVTSLIIAQRTTEDADGMNLSGGLSLSHIVDTLIELDYKRLSSWDSAIKFDTGITQGQVAYFFRIQKCRLTRYKVNYFAYAITKEGLIRLQPKLDNPKVK